MGLFNVVIALVPCSKCGAESEQHIQFKYGDMWTLEYRIGSSIVWGPGGALTTIGLPGKARVLVEGQGGPCPLCGLEFLDYDVLIDKDVIREVRLHDPSIDFDALPEPYLDLGPP